jgi:hypothetical protein
MALLIGLTASLTACGSGIDLCCGYETSQDITSDVSVVRDGGEVVFQNVSAIIDTNDRYAIELRPLETDSPKLRYRECTYAFIDKKSGEAYAASDPRVQNLLKSYIVNGGEVILRTSNSCIVD